MNKEKVIYYKDELKDEFSSAEIAPRKIDEEYSYELNAFKKVGRVILYYGLAKPIGWLFVKLKYGHRVENRTCLKKARGTGYFLYGNHTNAGADPFIPNIIDYFNDLYAIVHPNNVSMPVFGHITPMLGAIPLPDDLKAARNFHNRIMDISKSGKSILIYPEAHIWPYYTKIRPFTNASFGYPVQCGAPVYCFTNTYQKRKLFKTPRIVTYVDGPFYADSNLPKSLQKERLREQVYDTMVGRSLNSNVEVIKYIKDENA